MTTIAALLRDREDDMAPGLRFEDQLWTWSEVVQASSHRASLLLERRRPGPFHVGVLLDNVAEFSFWLGAAALAGAVVVGVNPTRRGAELARDIAHTACQLLVTETAHLPLLAGLVTGVPDDQVLVIDAPPYEEGIAPHQGADMPDVKVEEADLFLLLFTSGTSGAPKACRCTQGRLAGIGVRVAETFPLRAEDVCYLAMPMFHSNALMVGWAPALAAGATVALRRRFSASGFLPDVRKFGATYFNYVGKPLSYVLATPERPDDADNPLRLVFGNEAADTDIDRFAARFGCTVVDSYGSTEGGATVLRTQDMPPGALGVGPEGTVVLDPGTGQECPRARFDEHGRLLNPDEAIGELVNRLGAAGFEGYWDNQEGDAARVRDGMYWTGDLAYRDEAGFFYFAGRDFEWLRVDGENFAAAPVERILARHPAVLLATVYAVPDPVVGDRVMAALELAPATTFDPGEFAAFLRVQTDLGPKWTPTFVRVTGQLPLTPSNKVIKRQLRRERWDCAEPVWWSPEPLDRGGHYRPFTPEDGADLRAQFEARDRLAVLDAV